MPDSFGIEAQGLRAFARDLRRADKELAKSLRQELKRVGQIVADDARAIISADSTRIPQSIKVRVNAKGVSIVAGNARAPHAAVMEGGPTNKPSFRHPVFGDMSVWVAQDTHPFMVPALKGNEAKVIDAAEHALDEWQREAKFQ